MVATPDGWVLWAGTVGFDGPLIPRLDAAANNGYRRVSLSAFDVARAEADGIGVSDLRREAADRGLRWVMDPILTWSPSARASRSPLAQRDLVDDLDLCEGLGVASITLIATTTATEPLEEIGDAFGQFCDRVAVFGADVHLEFLPMTYVPDLATAVRLVEIADRPNGGILFDTWHFYRGNPDFDLLSRMPGDLIKAIQVNDAAEEVVGTLWEDTMRRLLPGDGSFDLPAAMAALADIDGLSWIGPEVFNDELIALGPDAAARIARDRVEVLIP